MLVKQTPRPDNQKLMTDINQIMPTSPTALYNYDCRLHNLLIANSSGLTSKVSVWDLSSPPIFVVPPTNLNDGGMISYTPEDKIGIFMSGGIFVQSSQPGVSIKGNFEVPPIIGTGV